MKRVRGRCVDAVDGGPAVVREEILRCLVLLSMDDEYGNFEVKCFLTEMFATF